MLYAHRSQAGASGEAAACVEKRELVALAQRKVAAWEIRRILAAEESLGAPLLLRGQAAVFVTALGDAAAIDRSFKDLRVRVSVSLSGIYVCNQVHL
jgi:hypothetical protein